jgi:hypothetical protein
MAYLIAMVPAERRVERAFLLTPIPEPASTSLVAGGLVLLLGAGRNMKGCRHLVVV